MKTLVTGASGFVGSWLTRRLVEAGHQVRVLSRKPLSSSACEVALGDICDRASVEAACQDIDVIYHLAGVVGYSRAMRDEMERVNVGGTQNVIDAALKNQNPKLVVMSSVTAVGASFDGKLLDENSHFNISHLNLGYFETKHAAELLVMKAVREKSLPAVVVNPSTIYGPGDAQKGSRKTQLKVAQGKMPFYTSGGVSVIGVDELVDAVIAAADRGRVGERYILSGENITIKTLFDLIARFAGVRPPSIYLPNFLVHGLGHVGDVLEDLGKKGPLNSENAWTATLFHWFDASKAKRELGLRPKPAAVAIEQSVKWIKDHKLI